MKVWFFFLKGWRNGLVTYGAFQQNLSEFEPQDPSHMVEGENQLRAVLWYTYTHMAH